jgi:3-oxoacyl-[acyl-carrier-protein] synthase II
MMAIYIRGVGNISPQKTWGEGLLLAAPKDYAGDILSCIEPEYEHYIKLQPLRRMSRIIKMGTTAALMALQEAGITMPDSIISGTGYGCLEDTSSFLEKMINNKEQALNPTPFIQSTHNTIGSQIALMLQCQGYNQTYTHEALSFESSLLDAFLELADHPHQNILVGGVDEIVPTSHAVQSRFGVFRENSQSSLDLFKTPHSGTLNGEGAAYFVLSGERGDQNKVLIQSLTTLHAPDVDALQKGIEKFLTAASLTINDIDLVLLGKCGDYVLDQVPDAIAHDLFPFNAIGMFKHLCGEYPTASAFALWLGTRIIQLQNIPPIVAARKDRPITNILIYNPYFGKYHSLILLSAC